MKIYLKILIINIYLFFHTYKVNAFDEKIISKVKKSVVTIKIKAILSANFSDNFKTEGTGTGFLVDKQKGFILTNAHIAGINIIADHSIIFFNGNEIKAKVLYIDPYVDYAILKIDPKEIPTESDQINFSEANPSLEQKVFIVGNNASQEFSINEGKISGLYENLNPIAAQCFLYNLNSTNGSSGSPVVDEKGEAVGLNFAGANSMEAYAIHPGYVKYALKFLRENKKPIRKHIGAILEYYSLAKAIELKNFPKDLLNFYNQKFPLSRAFALRVNSTINGAAARDLLKNGDIIWSINGKLVGPNIIDFDLEMSTIEGNRVKLEIIRDCKKIKLEIPLYDLEESKVKKILKINEIIIFKADSLASAVSGAKLGYICVLHPIYRDQLRCPFLELISIDDNKISNVIDIWNLLPLLKKKRYYYSNVKFHLINPNTEYFNYENDSIKIMDLEYDPLMQSSLYEYDDQNLTWKVTNLS